MMARLLGLGLLALGLGVDAAALPKRATCSQYTIINTRGTGEPQGPSAGFRTMNSNVMSQLPGGTIYSTVYSAGFGQDSSQATTDIVNHVTTTLSRSPNMCFILEGYSQGAAGTVNALSRLTGNAFDAVVGVFLIGDPEHKAGLACNVDNNGGTTTANVNGLESFRGSIPDNWVSKTLDVCIAGDGVCDTQGGGGITAQHLQYPRDAGVQNLGTKFLLQQLGSGGGSAGGSGSTSPTTTSPGFPGGGFGGGLPTGGFGGGFPGGGFGGGRPTHGFGGGFPTGGFGGGRPTHGFGGGFPGFPREE